MVASSRSQEAKCSTTNPKMILLLDIGNTNTHLGLADDKRILRQVDMPTRAWHKGALENITRFTRGSDAKINSAAVCSVVPAVTPVVLNFLRKRFCADPLELTPKTLSSVGIDYPRPWTIGPDRLANAAAARVHFGAPVVVVDFGTAVTFDVVNRTGNYVGGIIAPGLTAMTEYLHEKTALLPKIRIAEVESAIGKSTREAMLIGAVHGYRGLIRELISEVKAELRVRKLPVIATGGYAALIAAKLPEITAVDPLLTLEGLRICHAARELRQRGYPCG